MVIHHLFPIDSKSYSHFWFFRIQLLFSFKLAYGRVNFIFERHQFLFKFILIGLDTTLQLILEFLELFFLLLQAIFQQFQLLICKFLKLKILLFLKLLELGEFFCQTVNLLLNLRLISLIPTLIFLLQRFEGFLAQSNFFLEIRRSFFHIILQTEEYLTPCLLVLLKLL